MDDTQDKRTEPDEPTTGKYTPLDEDQQINEITNAQFQRKKDCESQKAKQDEAQKIKDDETQKRTEDEAQKKEDDAAKKTKDDNASNYVKNLKISASSGGLSLHDYPKLSKPDDQLFGDSKTVVRFSPIWKQSLAAMASILVTFTGGLTSGYSAILLPQLKLPGSVVPGDDVTASWIASMAALPMAPGCLISGWMMEKFGRKFSHYIICAPLLVGWILIACANSLTPMLLGRFLTGLCVGLLGPLVPVYVGETTDPKYRGLFLAAVSLAIAVGIFVAHLIGTFLTWQWTAIIFTMFPVLSVLLLLLVPESPTWLITKGKTEEGINSFFWLRGYGDEAKAELNGILEKQKVADAEPKLSFKEKMCYLKGPEFMKPLVIMILFFFTCQFSGVNAVAFYSIEIVEKSVGKGLDHYTVMLLIDTVRVIMSVVACVISKKYGRRPLCFISGIWTAMSMVGLSMFLYWTEGQAVSHLAWIPLACLMSYICAISVGLVPLPWIMCGEVFPSKVRGVGSGISSALAFTAFFAVVKTAPGMMAGLGEVITFLSYGVVAAFGTIVMYFILPETKGKSLQEIEEKFKSGSNRSEGKV